MKQAATAANSSTYLYTFCGNGISIWYEEHVPTTVAACTTHVCVSFSSMWERMRFIYATYANTALVSYNYIPSLQFLND